MARLLRPGSWPIAVRMSCDLLVAAVVPLLIGTWVVSSRSRAALANEARTSLSLLAQVTATRLDQLFTDSQRALEQLAGDDRVTSFAAADVSARPALEPAVAARLALAARSNPDFAFVMLLDGDGSVLSTTDASTAGQNYRERAYFHEVMASGQPYLSELLVGRTTRRPGVFCSSPIRAGNRTVGVAVIKLQGERIWEIVDGAAPTTGSIAMVTDSHGVILAHTNRALLYHGIAPLSPAAVAAVDPRASFARDDVPLLGIPELVSPLVESPTKGSAVVDLAGPGGHGEPFAAGYAPMATRGWMITVLQPYREFEAPLLALARQQRLVVLAVAILAAAYALWRARGIVRPIRAMTTAAQKLSAGDFDARVEVRDDNELGRLARVFNEMVPRLREHVDLRQSLALAVDVQQALLPAKDPVLPGLDIAGRSTYCDATGGDYYDFIDVSAASPRTALIALGDVMGHGVASALLMASARAALRAAAAERGDLAELLTRVNRVLAADARHGRFMTMVIASIEMPAGDVRWASAAHDPIIAYDPATDGFDELAGGDLPLGVEKRLVYEMYERRSMPKGTVLLLGTDGIWEMRNSLGEMFGKERLLELIRTHARATAAEISAAIDAALNAFRGEERVQDDVTYVVVRLTG